MQSSSYRRTLSKFVFALVALTVGIFLSRGDNASATFSATTVITPSSLAAGANANLSGVLNIPLDDYNFSAVITGTPVEADVAPGPGCAVATAVCDGNAFAAGTDPALGEAMGTLTSNSTLGLTGNSCGSAVTPSFTFLNATVNIADTIDAVPQGSTNPGSGGTLDNMWSDDGSSTTGPDATAPWNAAWPGMDAGESTNRLPAQVDEYPSYLNILFDPDFPLTPGTNAVQPLARYAGATNVVGTSVVLDLVVFAPGVLSGAFAAPHPFNATSTIGYTQIAVLQDTTVEAAHGSISDFCSPLGTTTTLMGMSRLNPCNPLTLPAASCDSAPEISEPYGSDGTANDLAQITAATTSEIRYSNPASGTYGWTTQHVSLRDHDADGIENSLDSCSQYPQAAAGVYNPRTLVLPPGDPDNDNDGLADVCDPYDFDTNFDADGDGWENSYDNCPLVSNVTQHDGEIDLDYDAASPLGGPNGDSIGDGCDFNDNGATGDGYDAGAETGAGGTGITIPVLCANALNDDDKTGAGLVADDALINDGCPAAPGGALVAEICGDAIDQEGDGYVNDGCPPAGAFDEDEFFVGTNEDVRCGVGNEGDALPSTAWPGDLYSGGVPVSTDKLNVLDLTSFIAPPATARLNTAPGQANFNKRWDIDVGRGPFNNFINVTDLTSLIAANPKGYPPMFGGVTDVTTGMGSVKAFNGPACDDPVSEDLSDGGFLTANTTSTHTIP